jgi:hypothetical protein
MGLLAHQGHEDALVAHALLRAPQGVFNGVSAVADSLTVAVR